MKRKIKIIFLSLALLFFFQIALAQPLTPQEIANKVKNFLENAIKVGGVLAFLSLVYAGFLYLSSAGKIEQIVRAKKQILATFVGLILLLGGWLFLGVFRPEFGEISPIEIPQIPPTPLPSLERPEGAYLGFAEIPIETFLKGEENGKVGENSHYFNLDELKDLKNFLKNELLPLIEEVENKFKELREIVITQCHCFKTTPTGGERVCVPTGKLPLCVPLQPTCRADECTGDPCQGAREAMGGKMAEIASLFPELFEKNNELRKKFFPIKERMARFSFALKMINDRPFDSIFSRDIFAFATDYLQKTAPGVKWQISRVPLFEEIENLRRNSFVDFYCPKTGFYHIAPSPEAVGRATKEFWGMPGDWWNIPQWVEFFKTIPEIKESWEEVFKKAEEAEESPLLSPEYQLYLSCPFSVPFGEMAEKFLAALGEIIKSSEKIINILPTLPTNINDYYQLTFEECSPKNCSPICFCTPIPPCICICTCWGLACSLTLHLKAGQVISGLKEIKNEIEKIDYSKIEKWLKNWEEIEKEVRKREAPLTKTEIEKFYSRFSEAKEIVAFEIMASRMHYCLAHALEVEAGWVLTPCDEYKEGCLNPEGQEVKHIEDCQCEKSKECQSSYPPLSHYKCEYLAPAFWLAKLFGFDTDKCHFFNYFCCRLLEKK